MAPRNLDLHNAACASIGAAGRAELRADSAIDRWPSEFARSPSPLAELTAAMSVQRLLKNNMRGVSRAAPPHSYEAAL